MRVLVVEDEQRLAAGLRRGLGRRGSPSTSPGTAAKGCVWPGTSLRRDRAGHHAARCQRLQGLRTLREGDWTPILMLTAKDGE